MKTNIDKFQSLLNDLLEGDLNNTTAIKNAVRLAMESRNIYRLKIETAKLIQQKPSESTIDFINP